MNIKQYTLLIFWLSVYFSADAQKDEREKYRYIPPTDSFTQAKLAKNQWRAHIRPTERFDFIFNRGFLLKQSGYANTITSGSGTYFFGLGFNYFLSPKFMLKMQPGISLYRLLYSDSTEQAPIRPTDRLYRIRIGADYIESSFGIGYVVYRDTVKKRINSTIEAGVSLGYRIGKNKTYEIKQDPESDVLSQLSIPDAGTFLPFRLGVYARLSYRFVGIWAFYRLNPVYNSNAENSKGIKLPRFSPLEIGFSITL